VNIYKYVYVVQGHCHERGVAANDGVHKYIIHIYIYVYIMKEDCLSRGVA